MNKILLRAPGLVMLLLTPAAIFSQNLPPIAVNDTVYMCGSTITIYVQDNDYNPDGDPLTLSVYAGSINGWFSINGGTIDYTPNVGYTGLDSLVYVLCDDGNPPMCDTATVYIYVHAEYSINESATICNGDSIFLAGQWRTESGLYADSLTSMYGCDSVITTTLNVITPPPATITPDGPTNFCSGDSVTLTASGSAPSTWLWSTGETTQSIVVHSSGTYTVHINDPDGCASSASVNVNVTPAPQATVTPAGPIAFCSGDSVVLSANGSADSTWLWSTGDTTQSITVYNSGSYSVTVDYGSCSSTSSPVAVVEIPLPNATINITGSLTICEGDSVILSAAAGPYSYQWSTGETAPFIIVDTSGTYSVIITNSEGCTAASAAVTVNVNFAPQVTVLQSGSTTFCEGGSVTLTASTGNSWLWSTGATTQSITVDSTGNYFVTVDYGYCSRTSSHIPVTVNPNPDPSVAVNGPTTFCEGDSVTLAAVDGSFWMWNNGANTQSITVDSSGTYSVIVYNSYGCFLQSDPVVVNASPAPAVTISTNGPTTFCQGDDVTLTANTGASYLWSTGDTTQSITVSASGAYSVTVDYGSCSGSSAPLTVISLPLPDPTVSTSGPTTFCEGDNVTLYSTGAVSSWLWSNGSVAQNITVNESGNYWVVVSNGACEDTSAVITVIVNPLPLVTITPNNPIAICAGDSVLLTANGGTSWLWPDNSVSPSVYWSTAGDVQVAATDVNGCTGYATTNINIIGSGPSIITGGPTEFCNGDSCVLVAGSGSSWLWSTGDTTQTIVVHNGGDYTVISTSICGTDTSQITSVIVSNGAPQAGFNYTSSGGTFTFTNSSVDATTYTWFFGDNTSSNETSPVHSYTTGTYTVMLVCNNSCGSDTVFRVIKIGDELVVDDDIYSGFSPNGDGHNDFWNVPLLDLHRDNSVTIVNRWGNEVWKADNYNNRSVIWNGRNLKGDELPDGTYYYIITFEGEERRGWVFIKR